MQQGSKPEMCPKLESIEDMIHENCSLVLPMYNTKYKNPKFHGQRHVILNIDVLLVC